MCRMRPPSVSNGRPWHQGHRMTPPASGGGPAGAAARSAGAASGRGASVAKRAPGPGVAAGVATAAPERPSSGGGGDTSGPPRSRMARGRSGRKARGIGGGGGRPRSRAPPLWKLTARRFDGWLSDGSLMSRKVFFSTRVMSDNGANGRGKPAGAGNLVGAARSADGAGPAAGEGCEAAAGAAAAAVPGAASRPGPDREELEGCEGVDGSGGGVGGNCGDAMWTAASSAKATVALASPAPSRALPPGEPLAASTPAGAGAGVGAVAEPPTAGTPAGAVADAGVGPRAAAPPEFAAMLLRLRHSREGSECKPTRAKRSWCGGKDSTDSRRAACNSASKPGGCSGAAQSPSASPRAGATIAGAAVAFRAAMDAA